MAEEYISKQGLIDILEPLEPDTYGAANDLYITIMNIIHAVHGIKIQVNADIVKE